MSNDEMENQTRSIHLRLDKEFVDEIDQFTKEFRFSNRTDAMRFLMASGLKYQNKIKEWLNKDE